MAETGDRSEWDEETETEFAEFAQTRGISEMPPTPDDWLSEVNKWEPGPGTDDLPLEVNATLPIEHFHLLVSTLASIEDEHLRVVWDEFDWGIPFIRRVRVEGWWTEDEEGIHSTVKRDEAINLWYMQNRLFEAQGYNPIPAEEFFPLRDWVGWAYAVAEEQVVERLIAADDPTFAPLYRQRKAFLLEQGYTEEKAEQESRQFVARDFLLAWWCEGHNKQWIPADPRDLDAHQQPPIYPDKEMT